MLFIIGISELSATPAFPRKIKVYDAYGREVYIYMRGDENIKYTENGEIFDREFRALGGDIMTIVKPGCDHHPHSIERPQPIVDFIVNHR